VFFKGVATVFFKGVATVFFKGVATVFSAPNKSWVTLQTRLQVAKSGPSGASVIAKGVGISLHARETAPKSSAPQNARGSSTLVTNGHANAGVGTAMVRKAKLAAAGQMRPTSVVARTSFTGSDHQVTGIPRVQLRREGHTAVPMNVISLISLCAKPPSQYLASLPQSKQLKQTLSAQESLAHLAKQ